MPDTTQLPLAGAKKIVQLIATELANSVMNLFQTSLVNPTPATPLSTFTANVATFSGYAALTVTSVGEPFLLGAAWAVEVTVRFDFDSGAGAVGNQIGGWYWVDSGGNLIEYGTFNPSRPAQGDGQTIFVTAVLPIQSGQLL
jgi:hypothetical protein